jgi:hypothetical protein
MEYIFENNYVITLGIKFNEMKLLLSFIVTIFFNSAFAQTTNNKVLFKLPITNYIEKTSDSTFIVQVLLQPFTNIEIAEKTVAIIKHSYANNKVDDTSTLAVGKCYLIKGNYYYFVMTLKGTVMPVEGDLIMLLAKHPLCYMGLLYEMSRNGIKFKTLEEKEFYNWETPFLLKEEKEELPYFNHMIADIKNTGKIMATQMPEANQVIKEGLYNGLKLFDALQKTTLYDLKEFFKYMKARPSKYAGQYWKISEIYATWITSKSPQVVE